MIVPWIDVWWFLGNFLNLPFHSTSCTSTSQQQFTPACSAPKHHATPLSSKLLAIEIIIAPLQCLKYRSIEIMNNYIWDKEVADFVIHFIEIMNFILSSFSSHMNEWFWAEIRSHQPDIEIKFKMFNLSKLLLLIGFRI